MQRCLLGLWNSFVTPEGFGSFSYKRNLRRMENTGPGLAILIVDDDTTATPVGIDVALGRLHHLRSDRFLRGLEVLSLSPSGTPWFLTTTFRALTVKSSLSGRATVGTTV